MKDERNTPASQTAYTLSREELHKEYAGEITLADFNTNHPNPFRMRQFTSADKFNKSVKKQEDYTFGK